MNIFLRRSFKILIAIAIIIGIAWFVENLKGEREWTKAKERAAKMDVSLDLKDYKAREISDSENLLKNPDFLREWNGEVDPELRMWTYMGLEGIVSRGIRSPRHYEGTPTDFLQYVEDETNERTAIAKLSQAGAEVETRLNRLTQLILSFPTHDLSPRHYSLIEQREIAQEILSGKKMVKCMKDQAILAIRRGEPNIALRNCLAIHALAQSFASPDQIHLLVSNAYLKLLQSIIWEGIYFKQWSSSDLKVLASLTPIEVQTELLTKAYSYDAAFINATAEEESELRKKEFESYGKTEELTSKDHIEEWIHFGGLRGWQQTRKAYVINAILDRVEGRDDWKWQAQPVFTLDDDQEFSFSPLTQVKKMARYLDGPISSIYEHAVKARLCRLAIAAEQFRLTNRRYPKDIYELDPGFPLLDLRDPKGRDLIYEPLEARSFQVYSEFSLKQHPGKPRKQLIWRFSEVEQSVKSAKKKRKGKSKRTSN